MKSYLTCVRKFVMAILHRTQGLLCDKNIENEYRLNPLPNKPWVLRVSSASLLRTLWKKEKLLITSNFSFSHSVFYPFGELSDIFAKFEMFVC